MTFSDPRIYLTWYVILSFMSRGFRMCHESVNANFLNVFTLFEC